MSYICHRICFSFFAFWSCWGISEMFRVGNCYTWGSEISSNWMITPCFFWIIMITPCLSPCWFNVSPMLEIDNFDSDSYSSFEFCAGSRCIVCFKGRYGCWFPFPFIMSSNARLTVCFFKKVYWLSEEGPVNKIVSLESYPIGWVTTCNSYYICI